ncbi:MAG: FtsX-like permease family protein [Actinobacteria bacterium]|nr:FtsX-like permease family protein [Actinomycetota bacterium]
MLKKIPARIIRRNLSQFLGIIFLVFLATFTYLTFSFLVRNIKANYKEFVDKYNQERFHFFTQKPVDISELERKYGLTIQQHFVFDFENGKKTVRFFDVAKNINKPYFEAGGAPKRGEISLDYSFCSENGIRVGDYFEVNGKKFRVASYVYLPNYVYIIRSDQDILPDHKNFGIGVMNFEDMKAINAQFPYYYYSAKGGPNNLRDLQAELGKKYGLLGFLEKEEDLRIVTTELKMKSAEPMTYTLTVILLAVSSFLLFLVLNRTINSMHYEIGTLYALGFSGKEIAQAMYRFPLLIWVLGSIPGFLAGYFTSKPFIEWYLTYFSIPMIKHFTSTSDLLVSMLLPGIFMLIATYIALSRLLRQSVVEIIRGESLKQFGKVVRFKFADRFSFKRRLMFKHALMHFSRELLVVFGIAFSTFLLLYVVVAQTAFEKLITKTYGDDYKYEYVYYFNRIHTDNPFGQAERFNTAPFAYGKDKVKIQIFGIEKNTQLINLKDLNGNKLKVEGFIITKSLADKLEVGVGDIIRLENKLDGKEYDLKITEIASIYAGNNGYLPLEDFNRIFGYPKGAHIGLFSIKKLNIPKQELASYLDKQYLIEVLKSSIDVMKQTIQVMALVSFLFALSIVYVLASLTISENRKPIALFKIFGYKNREISSIFLGFNNYSFLVGFVLGIPAYSYFISYIYKQLIKQVDFAIEMRTGIQEGLISFLLLLLVFFISKWLSLRKIYKISAAEILKEQMD